MHNIALAARNHTTRSENQDDYPNVVARLNPKLRVIRCADNIQWIAQHKYPSRWSSFAFCATKEGLLRRLPIDGIDCNPEEWKKIERLPTYYNIKYKLPDQTQVINKIETRCLRYHIRT